MSDQEQSEAEAESADASEDVEQEAQGTESGIQDGDFVRLAYTVRTADDGTVVDTTSEEVAEEAGIADEDYEFEPRVVVVGAGHVFADVDEELIGKDVGDEGTVDITAVDAFGEYDNEQVKTVSAEKIPEDNRYPGARVQVDNQQGHIETIIGGRARVDFNHPLAGEDIEYEYEVLEVVDDREEQAASLLEMYLQQAPEVRIETETVEEEVTTEYHEEDEEGEEVRETELQEVEKESLYIEATPQMSMNQQWLFSKQQIAQDLMDRLGVDRVVVEEVIDNAGPMGMGGLGGMLGGGAGGDIESALEDVDVDADEIAEELEGEIEADVDADVDSDVDEE